jgi:hypothetical protein
MPFSDFFRQGTGWVNIPRNRWVNIPEIIREAACPVQLAHFQCHVQVKLYFSYPDAILLDGNKIVLLAGVKLGNGF